MKKRLLGILLCTAMICALAAGCGGKTDSQEEAVTDSKGSQEEEVDTEASLVIPVTADVISLNMVQTCLVDTGLTGRQFGNQ